MKLKYYIDINLTQKDCATISKLVNRLHGTYNKIGKRLPITMPINNVFETLRIFSDVSDDLILLKQNLKVNDLTLNITDVLLIPTNVDSYISLTRFKIPSRKADQGKGVRENRMKAVVKYGLPYFDIHSKSQKTSTRYYFNVDIVDENPDLEIEPNGYGIGVSSRPFYVPNF